MVGALCCCDWAAGEGEAVLERFWGVREAAAAAGFLERLLCQGLWRRLVGGFLCVIGTMGGVL